MRNFGILLILLHFNLNAQTRYTEPVQYKMDLSDTAEDKLHRQDAVSKNTISGTIGYFDPWIGATYEPLIFSRWGIDASLGLIGGSVGTKFYFPKVSEGKVSFLIGISEGILLLVGTKHYIPAGLTYLGKNGFRFSIDIGPQIYHDSSEEIQFGTSLKLGKSF